MVKNLLKNWQKAIVTPLFEKRDLKDYTITETLVFEFWMQDVHHNIKLYKFSDKIIYELQNGFRQGRSCIDGYFPLDLLIAKVREYSLQIHLLRKPLIKPTGGCYFKTFKMIRYRSK
jgi:hypothetical protein